MAEELTSSVVSKVVDLLFGVAKKEINYMWNCSEHVEKFKHAVENLKNMRGRVQEKIDIASSKGDNLSYGVKEWVDKADVEISKAKEFLEQEANAKKTCFNLRLCVNLSTLHNYGKKASNKAPSLLQHQEDGRTYESSVSVETPTPGSLDVYQNKNLDDIITQNSALADIIRAIEDESIQIIGIYGVGGVGKTTLAMEVVARVRNLFAAVAFTTVSQTVNVRKVQTDTEKATKQIMQGKNILIVLDDVWEELNLEELCIPCGIKYKNCKILLTSRSLDVCEKMNARSRICVDSLPIKEAWILFKRVVGERVETDANLKRVAMKVTKECGGLPLIIQAVGKALKNKSIDSWDVALARLKKHAPLNIAPDIRKAFTHLKLSYDYLDSKEVKSCFLLCSMFPEDERILMEDLVYYGVALAKFNDLESMEDARERVQDAVNILTSSGLLLNVDNKGWTKMHDVVRDVALLIASEGKDKFLVEAGKGLKEWKPRTNALENYTAISLMANDICSLPEYELHFPHLDTLLIQQNRDLTLISNEFIMGLKKARILDMEQDNISSLPQSFKLLTNLRLLNLGGSKLLREISILGELKDLEILVLKDTGIEEIPQKFGQLVNLRRLDVKCCKRLSHIAPGVISKLRWLEELCIGFWSMNEGIHDSLVEVMNLPNLTYLDLYVPCLDVIPEGLKPGKLKGFLIKIGGDDYIWAYRRMSTSERCLIIERDNLKIPFSKWTKELIEVNPALVLRFIENLNNILPNLYHEGFNNLESIELYECCDVSCLVDLKDWDKLQTFDSTKDLGEEKTMGKYLTKLKHLSLSRLFDMKVLWTCPDEYISLTNLVTLYIYSIYQLKRLFPVSIAQGLVNLQKLTIEFCEGLKEVIWDGDEGETEIVKTAPNIVFPCLSKISFTDTRLLESFYSGKSTIEYPSLVKVDISDCRSLKIWAHGIQETPTLKFVNDVPLDGPCAINDAVAKCYENLLAERKLGRPPTFIERTLDSP